MIFQSSVAYSNKKATHSLSPPPTKIMLTIELEMVNKFWASSSTTFKAIVFLMFVFRCVPNHPPFKYRYLIKISDRNRFIYLISILGEMVLYTMCVYALRVEIVLWASSKLMCLSWRLFRCWLPYEVTHFWILCIIFWGKQSFQQFHLHMDHNKHFLSSSKCMEPFI